MRMPFLLPRLKTVARSKIMWSVIAAGYFFGVWLSAYKVEIASMDKNPEAERQKCPHPSEFRLLQKEKKPNPWLLESTKELKFSSRVLNNPTCFGAYLKDISEYKYYPYEIEIYDEDHGVAIFHIHKNEVK